VNFKRKDIIILPLFYGQVKAVPMKGSGLFTRKVFEKGDVICDYGGDLLVGKDRVEAREAEYDSLEENPGSYMCRFKHQNELHWYVYQSY